MLAAPILRESLGAQLTGKNDWHIYQNSTGASSRDVGQAANVSYKTVQNAWRRWAVAGVVVATDTPGRFERLVDLKSIGVEDAQDA